MNVFLARFCAFLLAVFGGMSTGAHAAERVLPPHATIHLGGGVTMEFLLLPPGMFLMGTTTETGDGDELSPHSVTLTQPFYFGRCEVTQAQWTRVMGNNPSHFKGESLPVDTVRWNDAQRFLAKLSALTGRTFTLPTEAQWEYASRAGTTTRWAFGDEPAALGRYAWYQDNSGGTTHAVGEKKANAWGLHDLYGNVGEWCSDWYANPYSKGAAIDPTGPPAGDARVVRGGAWGDHPINVRSAYRNANGPDGANDGIGFRCVMLGLIPPVNEK